jgi:hypothetical protein
MKKHAPKNYLEDRTAADLRIILAATVASVGENSQSARLIRRALATAETREARRAARLSALASKPAALPPAPERGSQ